MSSEGLEEFEFEEVDEDHREGVNTADFEPDGIMVTAWLGVYVLVGHAIKDLLVRQQKHACSQSTWSYELFFYWKSC